MNQISTFRQQARELLWKHRPELMRDRFPETAPVKVSVPPDALTQADIDRRGKPERELTVRLERIMK